MLNSPSHDVVYHTMFQKRCKGKIFVSIYKRIGLKVLFAAFLNYLKTGWLRLKSVCCGTMSGYFLNK